MSSPYGGIPTQACQNCGKALPANETHCGSCGHYNIFQRGGSGQPGSDPGWGAVPQTSYGQPSYENQEWQHSSVPPTQVASPFTPPAAAPYTPPAAGSPYAPSYTQSSAYGVPPQPPYGTGTSGGYQQQPDVMAAPYPPASPPAQKNRQNTGLIIGIVTLLVILVGGGIWGVFALTSSSNSSQTGSAPSVVTVPTPKVEPLFADSFKDNENDWAVEEQAGEYSIQIQNNELALEELQNFVLYVFVPSSKTFGDFKLTVDAGLFKGENKNGYGVYIRSASAGKDALATYYRFFLYGTGDYAIAKGAVNAKGESEYEFLVDIVSDSAIRKVGAFNQVAIEANGPELTFGVNGKVLKTIKDESYAKGKIALYVSNVKDAKPGAQAKFKNLVITPLEGAKK